MCFRFPLYAFTAAAAVLLLGENLVHAEEHECPQTQEELNAFVLACREHTDCENPAITCNGEFSIELTAVDQDGSLVTYSYEICKLTPGGRNGTPALSHWVLGVDLECLADGVTLNDLLVDYAVDGVSVLECNDPLHEEDDPCYEIIADPTTGLFGIKVEGFDEFSQGECLSFSLTFDESLLVEGAILGVGCVPAATKAGNQELGGGTRHGDPGYACVLGPVCVEGGEGRCETAWAYLAGASTAFVNIGCGDPAAPVAQKWGWEIAYVVGESSAAAIWAGAGQNDFTKGELVGFLSIETEGSQLHVEYVLAADWELHAVHLWVGVDPCGIPGHAAPGQFPYIDDAEGAGSFKFTVDLPTGVNVIYLAAHAEVCTSD